MQRLAGACRGIKANEQLAAIGADGAAAHAGRTALLHSLRTSQKEPRATSQAAPVSLRPKPRRRALPRDVIAAR